MSNLWYYIAMSMKCQAVKFGIRLTHSGFDALLISRQACYN